MAATYEKIATTTLGSAAADIQFTSIPATYTDLRISFTGFSVDVSNIRLRYNGDTATNYSQTRISGDGSATATYTGADNNITLTQSGVSASSTPAFIGIDIFSYAGSTYKTCLAESANDKNGSGVVNRNVGLWRNTAAITSIRLYAASGNLNTGTTATLYGILKA